MFNISDIVKFKKNGKLVTIIEKKENYYTIKDEKGVKTQAVLAELEAVEAIYKIPVSWELSGFVGLKAKSAEMAMNKLEDSLDDFDLPIRSYYVDASFRISDAESENLYLYQDSTD